MREAGEDKGVLQRVAERAMLSGVVGPRDFAPFRRPASA
jgi:hypothetical protein